MQEITLPVGIQADIDEAFCYREDKSYQDRAHEYLERYEVNRGYRDTAVQATVTDIARRAFEAGAQGCSGGATSKQSRRNCSKYRPNASGQRFR